MLLSLLLNLTEAGCLCVFPRKYSPHYRHFSFLPPFGILYPHRDCNLISTKESILRHFPLQSTSTREGPNKKSGLQGQERSEHQPLPGKQPWELWEWQKKTFFQAGSLRVPLPSHRLPAPGEQLASPLCTGGTSLPSPLSSCISQLQFSIIILIFMKSGSAQRRRLNPGAGWKPSIDIT